MNRGDIRNNRRIDFYLSLLLIGLTFLIYGKSLFYNFISDDWNIIVRRENFWKDSSNLRKLFLIPEDKEFNLSQALLEYFNSSREISYRPINTLSYFLDYKFWKLNPLGYHLTNVIFHGLNALLLYQLAILLTLSRKASLISALIFLLHPIQVEAVAVPSFREDLLALFFYLVAFYLAIKMKASRGNIPFLLLAVSSLLSYLLAILCKENAFLFPFLLILYFYFSSESKEVKMGVKFIPFFVFLFLISLFFVHLRVGYNLAIAVNFRILRAGILSELFTIIKTLAGYLYWLLFPVGVKFYLVGQESPVLRFTPDLLSDLLFLLILFSCFIFCIYKKKFWPGFGLGWLMLHLLPLGFIRYLPSLKAARYFYFPSVGFALLLGSYFQLVGKLNGKTKRIFAGLLLSCLLIFYGWMTSSQLPNWENDLKLWRKMAKDFPGEKFINYQYHLHYGGFLSWSNHPQSALKEYLQAYLNIPQSREILGKIAQTLKELGNEKAAEKFMWRE